MREEFERFALDRMAALLGLAFLMTHDPAAAEDVVQTALVKLYASWGRVQKADDPWAYARRVTVNAAIDRSRREREIPVEDWPERAAADAGPDGVGAQLDMRRYLGALPPRQRAVIVLRFYADLTERETAAELGITVGTVKSQTARALATLRRAMGAEPAPEGHDVTH